MVKRIITAAAALTLTLTAGTALAASHAGKMGYALANEGKTLVVMADISAPGEAKTFDLAEGLMAIAWRPVTGELLGFAQGAIYKIDPATGELIDLAANFMDDAVIGSGAMVAFDFNNQIDAVRAVSTAGDNLVYFPDGFGDNDERANSVRRFTNTAYAEGDANAGATPAIFANAYTNAVSGMKAASTVQYALDAETDSLVTLANNDGTLTTVGKVMIGGAEADISAMGGFDIVSAAEGEDEAYAILQLEGAATAGLYMIDLSSGAATLSADLGMGGLTGFAASMGGM